MENMYEPPKPDNQQIQVDALEQAHRFDHTQKMLKIIGFGLLVAFFFPLYYSALGMGKMMFINFELISKTGVPGSIKFQALYPLLAGAMVLYAAGKHRSFGKGWSLIMIGLFPFIILIMSAPVQKALAGVSSGIPGSGGMGLQVILSNLGMMAILSGACASYVRPGLGNYNLVAAGGGVLYLVSLVVPHNGQIPLLEPFKMMFGKRFPGGGGGYMFIAGLAGLAVVMIMILVSIKCLQMRNPHKDANLPRANTESLTRSFQVKRAVTFVDHRELSRSALKLWVAQFYVYGAFLLYTMIAAPGASSMFIMMIMGIIKFIPWILGLYLLIPIGISELMLAGNEPPKPKLVV